MDHSSPPNPPSVLLVAYHFPPFKGSSGLERTLAFCRHLPSLGWKPIVLTAHPRAYASVSEERLTDIPADVVVAPAFALDTARHLSIRGAYPGWAALPDRWISWVLGAVPHGLSLVRKHRPKVVWSTYPIATAHIIGWLLHRFTGLPWIADFRDPMVEFNHRKKIFAPADAPLRKTRLWIERKCALHASRVIFCTEGALEIFASRYPKFPRERASIIPNGYDESAFNGTAATPPEGGKSDEKVTLLHSGVLYPGPDRDPTAFLRGLEEFLTNQPHWRPRLRVILRATGFDEQYAPVISSMNLQDVVQLAPLIPYRQALEEMLRADGLLIFQGYTSNPAIPAKVYEYLRARRPILALLHSDGDTARLLRNEKVGTILPIEDAASIATGLGSFLDTLQAGSSTVLPIHRVEKFERRHGAESLARILFECTGHPAAETPSRSESDAECVDRCS